MNDVETIPHKRDKFRKLRDGEPCSPTCVNHVTHPCEKCGRRNARGIVVLNDYPRGGIVKDSKPILAVATSHTTFISKEQARALGIPIERKLVACKCHFQIGSPVWGYQLREWVGDPKFWRPYARLRRFSLAEVEKRARQFTHVLISCGGCGSDICREYGPDIVN